MSEVTSLIPIPTDQSLVAVEETAAAWIESRDDPEELRRAQSLLEAWRHHYERGSAEADAAKRLHLRAERRLGMLLPKRKPGRPPKSGQPGTVSESERHAESRARALGSVPQATFEEELAKPKPSRDRILAKAIVPEQPDPVIEESRRLQKYVKGPHRESWPDRFGIDNLNTNAIATVEETIDTWEKWSAAWRAVLTSERKLRRVQ